MCRLSLLAAFTVVRKVCVAAMGSISTRFWVRVWGSVGADDKKSVFGDSPLVVSGFAQHLPRVMGEAEGFGGECGGCWRRMRRSLRISSAAGRGMV